MTLLNCRLVSLSDIDYTPVLCSSFLFARRTRIGCFCPVTAKRKRGLCSKIIVMAMVQGPGGGVAGSAPLHPL